MLWLLALAYVLVANACFCTRSIDTFEQYEYLQNTLGLVEMAARTLDEDPAAPTLSLRVEFRASLIQFSKLSTELSMPMMVAFVPQSTCALGCQAVTTVYENWTMRNGSIESRERRIPENVFANHVQDRLVGSRIVFDALGKEYSDLNAQTNISDKIDVLDRMDRGACCHYCCKHFMDKMNAVLGSTKEAVNTIRDQLE